MVRFQFRRRTFNCTGEAVRKCRRGTGASDEDAAWTWMSTKTGSVKTMGVWSGALPTDPTLFAVSLFVIEKACKSQWSSPLSLGEPLCSAWP